MFKLTVLSPEQQVFTGSAISVALPSFTGDIEIFEHHAPLLSLLSAGYITIHLDNQMSKTFFMTGGYVEVSDNVRVIADKIYDNDAVNKEFFLEQVKISQEKMNQINISDNGYDKASDTVARYQQLASLMA